MHIHVLGSPHHVHNKNSGIPLYVLQEPCMIVSRSVGCWHGGGWLTSLWYRGCKVMGYGATWVAISVGETAKARGGCCRSLC